jgi:membrane protein DedA with SNARE-associated domain
MDELIIRIIEQGGYLGIFLLMIIENVIPPIPSEVIMGLGGVAVARGTMDFWPLMAAGTVGSTLGNYAWFLLGDKVGYRRLQPMVDRWGRWLTVEWRDIERASDFFRKHGQWAVLVLRCSPFLRTLISLPAGLAHMPHWRFLAFTFVGAAAWNALLVTGGKLLADWLAASAVFEWIILGGLGLGALIYLWRILTWRPSES